MKKNNIDMTKIYVIAHTWCDIALEIEHFYTPSKTVKRISELVSDEFGIKANPDDDPEEYLQNYYQWVREENDGISVTDLVMTIINL